MIDNSHLNKDIFNGLIRFVVTKKKDGNFKVDDNNDFGENVKKLRLALGVDKIIAPVAEHSSKVVLHNEKNLVAGPAGVWRTKDGADGYIITTKDQPAAVMYAVADCPCVVALAELPPRDYALGLIHCGWRSLAAGILDNFIEKMESFVDKFRVRRVWHSLKILITPGIGQCCFEVNEEIAHALAAKYKKAQQIRNLYKLRCYIKNKDEAILVDLFKILWCYFEERGVRDIVAMKTCTKCSGRFFSHRRGNKERNAVAAAFLPQAFPKISEPKRAGGIRER